MTETGFGPGVYGRTPAEMPATPTLTGETSVSVRIAITADGNPSHTTYAIRNDTTGLFVSADGSASETAVWRTRNEWGETVATGLEQATTYRFSVAAKNADGEETGYGPQAEITTYSLAADELETTLTVAKASSTVSAPAFMSGLAPGIRVGGKDLAEFGFYTDSISGLDMPSTDADEELVPGAHEWRIWDEYFTPKRIVLEGYLHGASPGDLRLRLAFLKSFLATFSGYPWRSNRPVKLERTDLDDRYWEVYYESVDEVTTVGRRELASSARVRVTMKCPNPFARAGEVTRVKCTPSTGTFIPLDLGNAPSDAVYVIEGPSENPSISMGDMVFACNYSEGLAFSGVTGDGTGVFDPAEGEASAYRTTETGIGIMVEGTDTVTYTATGNPADGAWVAVIAPDWQSTARTEDAVVFEHRGDADNYLRLYWDGSAQAWVFRKRVAGVDHEAASDTVAFTAGTVMVLGFTYDSTNAGGMKLFIDGVPAGMNPDTAALETIPVTLTLHAGDGTMQPDAIIDMAAGWSRMLSSDEMLTIAVSPETAATANTTVSYGGTLDEGDLLVLDSRLRTARLFDVSAGEWSNALDDVTGAIPALVPGRRRTASDRTQTMLFVGTAAGGVEARYRRMYL